MGIEPTSLAWKATALPLSYARAPACVVRGERKVNAALPAQYQLTASVAALAALNLTDVLAAKVIVSPVRGLRP